ncbi:MAG: hypothetical protein ACLPXB_13585 [Thiobacillaceae bacterium]
MNRGFLVLPACGVVMFIIALTANAAPMTVLTYRDQDPGSSSYVTRILITPRFVRLDGGKDDGDFVLLDRRSGELVNVLHDARTTMRIRSKPLPEQARPTWKVDEQVEAVRRGTWRITLLANGAICSQTVVAGKLRPEAAQALAEYKAALAWAQYKTYENTPKDIRQDCDLVEYVWDTGRVLKYGLPLEERDYAGRVRRLEKVGSETFEPELFKLPTGYAVTYPNPK